MGVDITACPKLTITLNADGKRTVKWDRPINHVKIANTKEVGHDMGQVTKKPNVLDYVGHKEKFSGPSQFERDESSNAMHRPTQVGAPKVGGAVKLHGPQKENISSLHKNAENNVVKASVVSSLVFKPTVYITQESTSFLVRNSRISDISRIRIEYFVGINLSVPRNLAGYWGARSEEAAPRLFMGELNMEWADSAKFAVHKESHCLALVPRDSFRDDSPEEGLDILPLNSYQGESIPRDQSEWIRQNMEVFSKQMEVSIEGCEVEAMALFTAIEQRWRQTEGSQTIVCMTQQRA